MARVPSGHPRGEGEVPGPCADVLPLGGEVLEHVAAIAVGRCERGSQVGGRRQEAGVAATNGGPHGEERGGR